MSLSERGSYLSEARNPVALAYLDQIGLMYAAHGLRRVAAGVKSTSRRGIDGARDLPLGYGQHSAVLGVRHGHRFHQRGRIGVDRIFKDLFQGSYLNDQMLRFIMDFSLDQQSMISYRYTIREVHENINVVPFHSSII